MKEQAVVEEIKKIVSTIRDQNQQNSQSSPSDGWAMVRQKAAEASMAAHNAALKASAFQGCIDKEGVRLDYLRDSLSEMDKARAALEEVRIAFLRALGG